MHELKPHLRRTLGALALAAMLPLAWSGCSRHHIGNREVWAKVNGEPIYRDQVEGYYRSRRQENQDAGGEEQAESFKLNILNQLIDHRLLLDRAAEARIIVSPAEIDARLKEIRSPYSDEEFQSKLAERGLTASDLHAEVQQDLLIDKLINQEITSRVRVTEAEMKTYYQQNQARFEVRETQYHLAQILVTPGAGRDPQNLKHSAAKGPRQALRKIRMIYDQLRRGKDFPALATEYSEDPRTSPEGGDMGFIAASSLAAEPRIGQAVATLKQGEYSGIVRDRSGDFHIFKLLGREDAGRRDLSNPQVASSIRQTLTSEKEQLLKAAYIEMLRNRAKVVDYLADQIVHAGGDPEGAK